MSDVDLSDLDDPGIGGLWAAMVRGVTPPPGPPYTHTMEALALVATIHTTDWHPGDEWHCTTDHVTEPCGKCVACREDQAQRSHPDGGTR